MSIYNTINNWYDTVLEVNAHCKEIAVRPGITQHRTLVEIGTYLYTLPPTLSRECIKGFTHSLEGSGFEKEFADILEALKTASELQTH